MEESEASIPASMWSTINNWCTPTILFIFLNFMIATILFTSNLPNNNNINTNKKQQDQLNQTDHVQSKLPGSKSILTRLKSFNIYPQISQPQPQQQHETLETVATEYVFNHPFPHQQDLLQPLENETILENANPNDLDLDPTRIDLDPTRIDLDPTRIDPDPTHLDDTFEVPPSNIQTLFVLDKHTVEKVTTHYDFGPTRIENEEEKDELQSLDEVYSIISGAGHVDRTKSDTIPASGEVPVKLPSKMKKSASLKSAFSHFEEEKIVEARRPATVRERKTVTEDEDVEVDAKADDFINKFKHQLKLQRLDSIIRYKDMVNRGTQK